MNKAPNNFLFGFWDKLLAFAGALLILYPMNPSIMQMPFRDSGVFLYLGWRILNGETPYLDIWDHKPPAIYYINALGLLIGDNSRWGVWGIELLSLFIATWLMIRLLNCTFGILPTLISVTLFLSGFMLAIESGNFTEEYALPIQLVCFLLSCNTTYDHFNNIRGFTFGGLIAISFFMKQTAIGIGLAFLLYLIMDRISTREKGKLSRELLVIASGGLLISALVVSYFFYFGALDEFIDAVFVYNFHYIMQNPGYVYMPRMFIQNGLMILALIGLLLNIVTYYCYPDFAKQWRSLLFIATIDIVIELVLVNLSGNLYRHYYLTLLPCLTILGAFAILCLQRFVFLYSRIYEKGFMTGIIITFMIWYQSFPYKGWMETYSNQKPLLGIRSTSEIEQHKYLLVWGAEAGLNFMLQKPSPSRFSYLYPLYQPAYTREDIIVEFLDDVITYHPLILNAGSSEMNLFDFPIKSNDIDTRTDYLKTHYYLIGKESDTGWTIYKYKP